MTGKACEAFHVTGKACEAFHVTGKACEAFHECVSLVAVIYVF